MKKLSHNELADLFIKAQNGDNNAFEDFYAATYTAQYFMAFRMVKDQSLAEDAVEEMYIYLYQNMNSVKEPLAVVQFMNRITYSHCINILKKENYSNRSDFDDIIPVIADSRPTPEEESMKKSDIDLLNLSLKELDPTLSSVLIKRYAQDMKINDIAKEMNVSSRTVIRYIQKGVVQMRKIMEKLKNSTLSLFIFAEPFVAKAFRNATSNNTQQISRTYDSFANTVGINTKTGIAATAAVVGTAAPILISTKILVGSVVAVAGVVGGGALVLPHYNRTISNLSEFTSDPITVSYTSTGTNPIHEVQLYNSNGELVTNAFPDDLTLSITKNDTYTIKVIGDYGFYTTSKVTVNNLDNVSPDVASISDDGVTVRVALFDSQSGIDWNRLSVYRNDGSPIDYWLEGNTVCFSNDIHLAYIHIIDYCNNVNTVTVSN